ncbi:MAG: hypothetical protein PVF63_03935 [Gammaproteobacteria bacterium]|jgi:hypothetical protein
MMRRRLISVFACLVAAGTAGTAVAQPPAAPARSGREAAVIDLTGQWVAIVNEDWRWRMITPAKGDYESVQTLNAAGRAAADRWDESQDGSCKAYGAGGLLRMPTRVRIDWADDDTLRLRSDAGNQTRMLHFDAPPPANTPNTLQGYSVAHWAPSLPPPGRPDPARAQIPPMQIGGSLEVTTTNLSEGWLRRNGVPYSDQTVLSEYFDRFDTPDGAQWFVVTTIVEDPIYHNGRYITSSHFRRETDRSGWNQTACSE